MSVLLIVTLVVAGYVAVYLLLKARISRALDPATVLREIRGEVDRMIVELNQTTDRNVSLVEDRIRKVSELLEAADKKIGLLRRESEKQEVASRVYSELKRAVPGREQLDNGGKQPADARQRVVALHARGISASAIARELGITRAEVELIVSLSSRSRVS